MKQSYIFSIQLFSKSGGKTFSHTCSCLQKFSSESVLSFAVKSNHMARVKYGEEE